MNIMICNKIDFASTDVSKIILCLSIYDTLQPTSSRTHHSTHYSRTLQQDSTAGLYSRTRYSRTRYSRTLQQDSTAGLTTLRIATPGGLPPANQQESLKKLHHRNLLTFRVKQNYGSGFVCRMSVKNNLE